MSARPSANVGTGTADTPRNASHKRVYGPSSKCVYRSRGSSETVGGAGRRRSSGTSNSTRPPALESQTPWPSISSVPSVPATTDTPTTPGVHDAAVCCSTPSTPDAIDTRTTNESSAPSVRALTPGNTADTDATSPNQVRSWSTTCDPDAPSHPPPCAASNHQCGTRLAGSATNGTYCTSENV